MDLKQTALEHLQNRMLPFWKRMLDEQHGGYYGYMGYDLQIDPEAPKGSILNSRILWFFSTAYSVLKDDSLIAYAQQAYAFLNRFWDEKRGGIYWSCTYEGTPLDTTKHTYAQAFAIYGLAAYAKAFGDAEALTRATALYDLIESRMKDEHGYLEAFSSDFEPLDNAKLSDNPKLLAKGIVAEKTMNTMLHVMEAYTLLYQTGQEARVRQSLAALLAVIGQKVYNPKENRLEVFFDTELRSVFNMQSYGHDIEASWLIDLAAESALDQAQSKQMQSWTTQIAQGVIERAFQQGSLLNEWVEGEIDPLRIWWVQAETVVGLANLWQKTGLPEYRLAMEQAFGFIQKVLLDPRPGSEWYWCVDEAGAPEPKPIVEPWKCPYHNGRMYLELISRL